MTLLARLTKKKKGKLPSVVCGLPACSAQLATMHIGHAVDPEGMGLGRLGLSGGWVQRKADGTWVLTEHAAQRAKQGQAPAFHRRPKLAI